MSNIEHAKIFQGNTIEILKILLKIEDNQLVMSWEICLEYVIYRITFYNVSRFKLGVISMPLEIHGLEIYNHYQNGWEKDSAYEIHDLEDDKVKFYCEFFKIDE